MFALQKGVSVLHTDVQNVQTLVIMFGGLLTVGVFAVLGVLAVLVRCVLAGGVQTPTARRGEKEITQ